MARRYPLNHARVQVVADQLALLWHEHESVRALSDALSEAGGSVIYPNRIQTLLSGDETKSINRGTLDAVERALAHLELPSKSSVADKRKGVRDAYFWENANHTYAEAVRRTATRLKVPMGVVTAVVGPQQQTYTQQQTLTYKFAARRDPRELLKGLFSGSREGSATHAPDWSWQDVAVKRIKVALEAEPDARVGLIVPTAGGKTRIALRAMLNRLHGSPCQESVALWVTHRVRLKQQAREALHRLRKRSDEVPTDAIELFRDRVRFVMVGNLGRQLDELGDKLEMITVDEAHHAAAASYSRIHKAPVPLLLLTATPNRLDQQPIGIRKIAYTTTYRRLFENGCVMEPKFMPRLDIEGLRWDSPESLRDLADYLLDEADGSFSKALVAVSRRSYAEALCTALRDGLKKRPDHPLVENEVVFAHGDGASDSMTTAGLLDEFVNRECGLIVATQQLVGEGFNDRMLDAVVMTYKSTSMTNLMQTAGRALRVEQGKSTPKIYQIHESAMEYHFEKRWLYQDISDTLRPDLLDFPYSSKADLEVRVRELLVKYNVADDLTGIALEQLQRVQEGETIRLMFTGRHYFESEDKFFVDSKWSCLLLTDENSVPFRELFNDVSERDEDVKEPGTLIDKYVATWTRRPPVRKAYVDLVQGMEYARRELRGEGHAEDWKRHYKPQLGSSWLRYVTLEYAPEIPQPLANFLSDAVNVDLVSAEYLSGRDRFHAVVKTELPLKGTLAYLLNKEQMGWVKKHREILIGKIQDTEPSLSFGVVRDWQADLGDSRIPLQLVAEFAQFIRNDRFGRLFLTL